MMRGKAWTNRLAVKAMLEAGQKVLRATSEGMFSLSLDEAGEVVATKLPPAPEGMCSITSDEWLRRWGYESLDHETWPLFDDRKRPETTGLPSGNLSKIKVV